MITKQKNGEIFIPHTDIAKLKECGVLGPVGFIAKMLDGCCGNIELVNERLGLSEDKSITCPQEVKGAT